MDPAALAATLTASLACQPLLAVLRPRDPQPALAEVALPLAAGTVPPTNASGGRQCDHGPALRQVAAAGLFYAFMPVWQPELLLHAKELGIMLVPGVFTPTEVHQARCHSCTMVNPSFG